MSRRDPPGADAHYRDGSYYDHAYARYKSDVAFYVELARTVGGPVLELGIGTGRVAMALAASGISVVGVDKSDSMLERADARLAKKPKRIRERIEIVKGDFREVSLGRRFPLVIAPFNAFQHLYTREDIEQALAVCKRHIEPDGRLAFDVLAPDPVSLARDPDRFYRCRSIRHPRDGRRYGYQEAFRYDHDTQIQVTVMLFTDLEDPSRSFVDQLPQRQFFPRELEALLHYNGFEVLTLEGGFEEEPVDLFSESLVVVARPRD